MNPFPYSRSKIKGSILGTVILLTLAMAVLTASMLSYSLSERKGNERNRLILRSQTSAENIALYAAEQLTAKLYRLGTAPVGHFPWSGTSTSVVIMPPDSVLVDPTYNPTSTNMEMRCGIEATTPYTLITDPTSPNNGLQVATANIPIIAKGTASHPAVGAITSYVEQDMQLALTPLFQFGMFFNMDMELYPSANFTVTGPVNTNKRLLAHPDNGSTLSIIFTGRVTSSDVIIADAGIKSGTRGATGAFSTPTPASGDVIFTNTDGVTQTSLKNSSNLWRDCRWLTTDNPPTISEIANFKTWANGVGVYNGNVKATTTMGATPLVLPGIGTYNETDLPSTLEDDRNNGRQIIESPDHKRYNGTTFAWTSDSATSSLPQIKISWRAGLYIMVNPDNTEPRQGKLPDGTIITLLPRSYRCWLNTPGSGSTHTCKEVILPGQPSFGYYDGGTPGSTVALAADDVMYQNNLPNQFTNTTSVGHNQVFRIPTDGHAWDATIPAAGSVGGLVIDTTATNPVTTTGYSTGGSVPTYPADASATPYVADAYFYDLRRANGSGAMGSTSGSADFGRGSLTFVPRPINKIDLDMARLKMMVNRVVSAATTSTGYQLMLKPGATTLALSGWNNYIYNPGATPAALGLGVYDSGSATYSAAASFPDATHLTRRDPFQLYYAPTTAAQRTAVTTDPTAFVVPAADLLAAWYDGVAIYIHSVDAEQRSQTAGVADRLDSGVRLWNGRGPVASLTTATKTGCTICTNDAVYIVGHYNADGTINSTTTATGNGGYSATYPDSANEYLCSVYGDAITILAQPVFAQSGVTLLWTFGQTDGWCDAKSALPVAASVSGWNTSGAGSFDGVFNATAIKPGIMPNLNTPYASSTTAASSIRLPAPDTEISTAMVVGIVPSNHNPTGLTDHPPTSGVAGGGVYTSNGTPAVNGNNVNSGGANNFTRLNDDWSGNSLYIRGSMVALFESRVAMEPFTHSRCYKAPGRYWGLNYNFSQANHDVPLEPVVLNATRMGYRRLTAAQYAARKATIEGWTVIP